jgi:uncharacterized membrane protein YhaH (DUF805 family)
MAKKERKSVSAESGRAIKRAKPAGNAGGLRLGAVIFWLLAIACEVVGVMVYLEKFSLNFPPTIWQMIGFFVLDFIFVIIGSSLWKKANRLKPASRNNRLKFWLWNNLGLVVCCFAFVPYIIIVLLDKHIDKKTKTIAAVAAFIALLIVGVLISYDFNTVSALTG